MTVQLTADPSNGAGETDQSLGDFPVDSKIMLIATGYVVRTDNYIPEQSANLGPGQSVGVIRRKADGGTESLTFPNNGGQVADTQLVPMAHGQSLIKVVRNGENPLTRTNLLWKGQYINCSPSSNPPCLSYSGGHTIQAVTIHASYTAAADSGMYSLWSTAEFRLTASPDTIFGGNVPMQIDSAIWTPAPDSVGGNSDPSDSASLMGCGGFGYVNVSGKSIYHCTRFIRGAGTMTFIAHANGFRQQSQPVQINVRDKRLTLIASRSAVHAGDTVKFTPLWSDGTAVSPQWWQWFPDSGSNQIGGDCAHTAPTCTKNIPQSGTMKVWVWQNTNLKRAASAHVTVYTTFDLVADKETAYPGDTVTFTARLDQKPAVAKSWRWVPSDTSQHDGTACAGVKTCPKVMVGSGTMKAWLGDPGSSDSAAKTIIVLPLPRLQLAVTPGSVRLGQSATFTASASGASFTISRWSFEGRTTCGTSTQCTYAPPFTGTMWAFGQVRGYPDSASASVSVTLDSSDSTSVGTDSTSLLRVIASSGVAATPLPGVYVYPKTAVVTYADSATPGYINLIAVLDDTAHAASGTLAMTRDHRLESAADSNYIANPLIKAVIDTLTALVTSSNPAGAFANFLVWHRSAAQTYGAALVDSALGIGQALAVRTLADYSRLVSLDSALAGYVFTLHNENGDTIASVSPAQYASDTMPPLASRVPNRRSMSLSSSPASPAPYVLYVNGIFNDPWKAGASEGNLQKQALRLEYPMVVGLWYNPTWSVKREAWGPSDVCDLNYRREAESGAFAALTSLWRRAQCKARILIKSTEEMDAIEAYNQLTQMLYSADNPTPRFVGYTQAYIEQVHREKFRSVLFVSHSQGNMMVAQAITNLGASAQEYGQCTADVSLASPVPKASFNLADTLLKGTTIVGDILTQLPLTQNDFTPWQTDPISNAAQQELQIDQAGSQSYYQARKFYWGIKIHNVDANYFAGSEDMAQWLLTAISDVYFGCGLSPGGSVPPGN